MSAERTPRSSTSILSRPTGPSELLTMLAMAMAAVTARVHTHTHRPRRQLLPFPPPRSLPPRSSASCMRCGAPIPFCCRTTSPLTRSPPMASVAGAAPDMTPRERAEVDGEAETRMGRGWGADGARMGRGWRGARGRARRWSEEGRGWGVLGLGQDGRDINVAANGARRVWPAASNRRGGVCGGVRAARHVAPRRGRRRGRCGSCRMDDAARQRRRERGRGREEGRGTEASVGGMEACEGTTGDNRGLVQGVGHRRSVVGVEGRVVDTWTEGGTSRTGRGTGRGRRDGPWALGGLWTSAEGLAVVERD